MNYSNFENKNQILDWLANLDQKWPERVRIRSAIVDVVDKYFQGFKGEEIHLLELGPGTGQLAQLVIDHLKSNNLSNISYTGVDINPGLISYTEQKLTGLHSTKLSLHQSNLNDESWYKNLPLFNLAYTFQTLHDLGGYKALELAYKKIYSLIKPDGMLLNADFIVPFKNDDPKKMRRFPVDVHQRILESIGFVNFSHEVTEGKLAIMTAVRL